jgi:type I restriction enzyme M protein
MTKPTKPKETATRKKVDLILKNLGWIIDEESPHCNVFTERAKLEGQTKLFLGNEPDYVLYRYGTDIPIAIIETKRPGQTLRGVLEEAITKYAKPLRVNIVFATDGTLVDAYDLRSSSFLRSDGDVVTDLLSEKKLLRFVDEGAEIFSAEQQRHTKKEVIRIFAEANELLRKEGLREGIERFTEFANLLFLKLISEIENEREIRGEKRILEKRYCWESFSQKEAPDMLEYINDTILPRLVNKYNHSGDVFQSRLLIKEPDTLKEIVDKLSPLTLLDSNSDVKGDAFEYFLKNSITVGNDLGEYFTPRHIVKLMVDLVDPKFGEKVYDPCCGTGGFLIQAFTHIKRKVILSKENINILKNHTVFGRELTGTAKIAKMNMIIFGDGHTNIEGGVDSLKFPIKEKYDVVLTNYPFSQTTDYAGLYGFRTKSANPIFLKHIIDALKQTGRAGVVVPTGLLFDESLSCVNVRRFLVEHCDLSAVIELHPFVFRPYTGQPTSILLFKKGKQTKNVWIFKVNDDGYKKTSSKKGREPIDRNDLINLRQLWDLRPVTTQSLIVPYERIKENNYKLMFSTYSHKQIGADWVKLGGKDGLCRVIVGGTPPINDKGCWKNGDRLWATIQDMKGEIITDTERKITDKGVKNSNVKLLMRGTLLFGFKLSIGKMAFAGKDLYTNEAIAGLIPKDDRLKSRYLYYILRQMDLTPYGQPAAKGLTLNKRLIESIKIPLPPPDEQEKIIERMDRLESVIRGYEQEIAKILLEETEFIGPYISN